MRSSGGIWQAYGLRVRSDFPFPELPRAAAGEGRVDLELLAESPEVVDGAFSGPAGPHDARNARQPDGSICRTERGRAGDVRIQYRQHARFHLTADARELRWWAADPEGLPWRRFLLNTVLGTAALEHGFEALCAGAFEFDGKAVAVVATQGGGESAVLAELVRRGRPFFSDDLLALSRQGGVPTAHPGPPLMLLSKKRPDRGVTTRIGRVRGIVDGGHWVAIEHAATRPRPLGAVVFLTRRGRRRIMLHRVPPNPAPLLSHALLSGQVKDRLAERFAMFAAVAATVPFLRLRVPVDISVPRVADVLELALDHTHAHKAVA